jgi:hypothetical protein
VLIRNAVRWSCVLLMFSTALRAAENEPIAPAVDHHQHLLSPRGAALLNAPQNAVELPAGIAQVLRQREESWNDPARLARLYSADAT